MFSCIRNKHPGLSHTKRNEIATEMRRQKCSRYITLLL